MFISFQIINKILPSKKKNTEVEVREKIKHFTTLVYMECTCSVLDVVSNGIVWSISVICMLYTTTFLYLGGMRL